MGRAAGERTLATWEPTASARCLACSRQSLGGSALELVQLGRWWWPRRLWGQATGIWPEMVEVAVGSACPWGLLQKARLAGRP